MSDSQRIEVLYNENDREWDVILRPSNICIMSFFTEDAARTYAETQGQALAQKDTQNG